MTHHVVFKRHANMAACCICRS